MTNDNFDIEKIHSIINDVEENFNKLDEWIIPRERFSFYLTHDFHPYFAAFPPELVKRLLLKYSVEGDLMLDPFMGGGSSIVEAFMNRRESIGVDISPFAKFIVDAKVRPIIIDKKNLSTILSDIDKEIMENKMALYKKFDSHIPDIINIDLWFTKESKYDLAIILKHLKQIKDKRLKQFLLLAFSSIIRKVSNSKNAQQHLCRKKNKRIPQSLPLFRDKVKLMAKQMEEYVATFGDISSYSLPKLYVHDVRKLDEILEPDSVDVVITSPPYGTGSKYTNIYRLHFEWLELDKPVGKVSMEKAKDFREQLKISLEQIYRVLKKDKYLCFVYGDPSTKSLTPEAIEDAQAIGFKYEGLITCPIEKTITKHHVKYRRFIPKDFIFIFKK